jgi:hypothetical protein
VAEKGRAGFGDGEHVGRYARSINEMAVELGCDWHTIDDTVIAYGTAFVDDPSRIGPVLCFSAKPRGRGTCRS